jgi:hypothetical protein
MASTGKKLKPTANSAKSPFRHDFGEVIGNGQDNTVREFVGAAAGHLVVKIGKQKGEVEPTYETAYNSTLYKKKKYQILKTFLGDFVPDSHFVVGHKTDGVRDPRAVPKSYTVQERVPQYKINQLTPEQQRDPRLLRQMYVLLLKLRNMYNALDEVNSIIGEANNELDGKLDLGGISKQARKPVSGKGESSGFDAAGVVRDFGGSPNLLVNPDTMKLSCIDFDDGVWSPQKEAAKGVLEHVAMQPEYQEFIQISPELPSSHPSHQAA